MKGIRSGGVKKGGAGEKKKQWRRKNKKIEGEKRGKKIRTEEKR